METKFSALPEARQQFNTSAPPRPGASRFIELELSLVPIEEGRPENEIRNDRQLWAAAPPKGTPFKCG